MKEGFLSIVKFFLFLLLLPLIIATAVSFQIQILALPVPEESWFLWGAAAFVLTYLFLYNFTEIYVFGQTIVSNLVKFFQPLVQVAGLVVPIYTILIICAILILNILGFGDRYEAWLVFALAFSVAMHIILTAHQLYEADKSPLKAHYLVVFGVAFVVNVFIISLLLGLAIPEFSFIAFFKYLSHHAWSSYQRIYQVLV